jgi:putative molybdopterin biosynthesis protein
MDFVPLQNEQYDLVMPREFYDSDLLQPLFKLIRSAAFQQQVEALGGYDVSAMGKVITEIS